MEVELLLFISDVNLPRPIHTRAGGRLSMAPVLMRTLTGTVHSRCRIRQIPKTWSGLFTKMSALLPGQSEDSGTLTATGRTVNTPPGAGRRVYGQACRRE